MNSRAAQRLGGFAISEEDRADVKEVQVGPCRVAYYDAGDGPCVGDYAVGFAISKQGEGWYFSHGGSNWGFRALLVGHKVKGYGFVVRTNADQGGPVMSEIFRRVQSAYEWDSVADPVPRGY